VNALAQAGAFILALSASWLFAIAGWKNPAFLFTLACMKIRAVVLASSLLPALTAIAQTSPDPQIMAEVNRIPAVDNHTHVVKVVGPGEKDEEFDALPCDPLEPSGTPFMAVPENPKFLEAWQKLFGYKYNDRDPERVRELIATKQQIQQQQGDNYPDWVLDKLNIQYMFANRIAMGRGLDPKRFFWVPFDDALMVPLDNSSVADNPDRKIFYERENRLLKKYMSDAGVTTLPATLDSYVAKVITPTLESQKRAGALAVKFEAAYLRPLDFGGPRQEEAARIYARYGKGGAPSKQENLEVQNALFRAIAREAGRLGLAVHLHTGTGCGGYFDLMGSNPGLLNSVLSDASLRKTNFVLIHGGSGPYTKVATFLLGKPNVYADFSEQDALISSRAMARVLRDWLEAYPAKVMFGTDLAPGSPEVNWEETGYSNAKTGREGLALALTEMVNDGEISRERALEIARMVMRGTAVRLYGLRD
jgi:predicted TIM-barrel fold metal-dependent hydrolase